MLLAAEGTSGACLPQAHQMENDILLVESNHFDLATSCLYDELRAPLTSVEQHNDRHVTIMGTCAINPTIWKSLFFPPEHAP